MNEQYERLEFLLSRTRHLKPNKKTKVLIRDIQLLILVLDMGGVNNALLRHRDEILTEYSEVFRDKKIPQLQAQALQSDKKDFCIDVYFASQIKDIVKNVKLLAMELGLNTECELSYLNMGLMSPYDQKPVKGRKRGKDQLNKKVASQLSKNPNSDSVEIAKICGINPAAVRGTQAWKERNQEKKTKK